MAKAVIVTGVLFTSDLHLGHKNIIQYCHRNATNCGIDFETLEEMDNFLIRKWNMKVNDDDEVYILGDFSFCVACEKANAKEVSLQLISNDISLFARSF